MHSGHPENSDGLFSRIGLYSSALHGSGHGWVTDTMVAAASYVPGLPGLAIRAVWDRLWIKGQGRFAMESGVRVLGAKYITIDDGVYLDQGVYLHGRPGELKIGSGTRLMSGATLHVYNFRDLADSGIRIGKQCVIGINSIITGQGMVVLEDNVIVAPGAMILPVDHNYSDATKPIRDQGITAKGVHIGTGAWIGAGAIILDGVRVGENAVVGAGAVVTRDLPARTLAAGNPAQVIKKIDE